MRDFFARRKAVADFGEGGEAGNARSFCAAGEKPLQPDADAEEGNTGGDAFLDRGLQAPLFEELRRGEVAYARKNDSLGASDDSGIIGQDRIGASGTQGLHHGGEIAGFVVDDGTITAGLWCWAACV